MGDGICTELIYIEWCTKFYDLKTLFFYETRQKCLYNCFTTENPIDTFQRWKLISLLKKIRKTGKRGTLTKPDPYGNTKLLALPTEHEAQLECQVVKKLRWELLFHFFMFVWLFYVRPSDFCSMFLVRWNVIECINRNIVIGLCFELLMRLSSQDL